MIEKVISGGQTGADQSGWRAARRFGIPTAGWMPKGYLTEDGPRPEFAEMYGAEEHASPLYPVRTRANVGAADWTLIFIQGKAGPGSKLTMNTCRELGRPMLVIVRGDPTAIDPAGVRYRLLSGREPHRIINVAGSRETDPPGVGEWVEEYLAGVFRSMGLVES